ncbi:MAG: hypothetical protein F6J95_023935 [Leptolyngbya sp. SIO1E4]|nr:hypothetical protein [Leptolyngbya sp. SIO1E4]
MSSDRLQNQVFALRSALIACLRCQQWLLQSWDELTPEARQKGMQRISTHLRALESIRPERN